LITLSGTPANLLSRLNIISKDIHQPQTAAMSQKSLICMKKNFSLISTSYSVMILVCFWHANSWNYSKNTYYTFFANCLSFILSIKDLLSTSGSIFTVGNFKFLALIIGSEKLILVVLFFPNLFAIICPRIYPR